MENYTRSTATQKVKVGPGKLYGIFVSSATAGTLTVYDSPASSTDDPVIANTFTVAAGTHYLTFTAGIFFNKGLYIVEGGTVDFVMVYD